MDIQEYPKALYRMGKHIIVQDEAEEEAQRAKGFTGWQTDQDRSEASGATDGGSKEDEGAGGSGDTDPLDREALKAKAKELGITFARNISTEQLAALVAGA